MLFFCVYLCLWLFSTQPPLFALARGPLFHAPPHEERPHLLPHQVRLSKLQVLSAWTHCRCILTSLWRNRGVEEAQSPNGPPTRHYAKE